MKNFSSRKRESSRRSFHRKLVVRIGAVAAVLVLLLWLASHFFGAVFSLVTKPMYAFETWVVESSGTIPSYFRERSELLKEIEALKREQASESGLSATIDRLVAENEELRALLGATPRERLAASVIGRPPLLPHDALLIDRGTLGGVSEGAVVYHHRDQAIGFVSTSYLTSALVTLFSTPGVSMSAYVYGPDIFTTMHGEGGGVVRVNIPQGIEVAEGDVVVVPTLESGVVGAISHIVSDPSEPTQRAYVTRDTSLQSLRFVSVSPDVPESVTFDEAVANIAEGRQERFSVDVPADYQNLIATSTATSTATSAAPTRTPALPATTSAPEGIQ